MTRQRTAASNILELTACLVTLLVVSISLAPAAAAQNPVPFIDQPLVPDATAPGAAGFTHAKLKKKRGRQTPTPQFHQHDLADYLSPKTTAC